MKEKPIIFTGPMVRATLDDNKTQTRRPLKPQPEQIDGGYFWPSRQNWEVSWAAEDSAVAQVVPNYKPEAPTDWFVENGKCPYQPGDRLWVREAYCFGPGYDYTCPKDVPEIPKTLVWYAADFHNSSYKGPGKGRPSIHMPRWASRLTLEALSVRVERVQDISEEDAVAEGVLPEAQVSRLDGTYLHCSEKTHKAAFQHLWNNIYGFDAWERNDWVFVYEFKKIEEKQG